MSLFTETVTLEHRSDEPTGTDRYGNEIYGTVTVPEVPAWYEIRDSSETTGDRHQVVSGLWLYLPLSAPLKATSRVEVDGLTYEVDGEPGRQPGGFVVEGYQKVALKRVTG